MKKILFMCINMNIGGTEKALLTMLNEIDDSKYDITLLMLEEYGGFLNEISGSADRRRHRFRLRGTQRR